MKQRWMIQAAGVASALTLLAGTAQAQVCGTAPLPECCVLGPVALPGLSGPPEWEDFDGDGFWRPELHDPRWSGAPLEFLTMLPDSGSPAWADDVGVRFLTQGNHLYVSYQVQVDDNGPSASDFVYLALTNGGANSAVALKVSAAAGGAAIGAPPASPTGFVPADTPLPTRVPDAAVVHWTTGDASVDSPSWEERLTTPTWLVGAARWDRAGVGSPRWAITLRIDLARLPFSPGNFRAFFGAQVNRSTGDVLVGNRRPRTDADSDRIPTTIIPHKLGDWAEYRAPGTSCPAGIRLSPSDVGVWTGSPGSTSPGSLTNRICAGESCGSGNNVFRVTARGVPNMGLSPFSVRARLRIADWGASVAHWNYGRWRDITKTPAGTDVFSAPSTAFTAANGWHWLTPVDAGDGTSSITIDYVCDKGSDAYCPKLEDESEDHQCMLVEVGQLGALAQFQRTAVYRNMEYEELSTLERRAKISIEGLAQVLGAAQAKDRDVYLYVETRNLPPHGEKPLWLPAEDMVRAREVAQNPIAIPRDPRVGGNVPAAARDPRDQLARVVSRLEWLAQLANSSDTFHNGLPVRNVLAMGPEQLLDSVWPTYRVRVYYDSGRTITVGKTKRPVLVPMVPFGYRLTHEGPFYGITHALAGGPGVGLERIDDDWYKVRIKSEGAVQVVTRVTAEEKPRSTPSECPVCPPCPECKVPPRQGSCWCSVVMPGRSGELGPYAAALVALAALLGIRRRARRSRDG